MIEKQVAHLRHVETLQKQHQQEITSNKAAHQQLLESRMREQSALLKAGFDAEAARQQARFTSLKTEYNKYEQEMVPKSHSLNICFCLLSDRHKISFQSKNSNFSNT